MKRIIASLIVVAGVAAAIACVLFLTREGLDRAEKWVSAFGMLISIAIGAAGLHLGFRQLGTATGRRSTRVVRSGDAEAHGPGSRANTGVIGAGEGRTAARDTGRAEARDGGRANTGAEEDGD